VLTNIFRQPDKGGDNTRKKDDVQRDAAKNVAPLVAYVGTFSSPLGDVLPTQVDLPPATAAASTCSAWIAPPAR
jgi:hypothetical protein